MQLLLMTQQAETVDKADQTEIMVAMKMGNENMGDLAAADLVIDHLYLCAFAAINKVVSAIMRYYLAGRMPVKCRNSRVIAKDGNSEHEMVSDFDV